MRPDAADLKKTDPTIPEYKDPPEPLVGPDVPETRLPPFLREQVRQREAYLTLIKDISEVLSQDWNDPHVPITMRKPKINAAIANSLRIWI